MTQEVESTMPDHKSSPLVPDFTGSHRTDTDYKMPGTVYPKVSSDFTDPMLSGYRAIVLNDSVTPSTDVADYDWAESINSDDSKAKSRLTTLLTRFPRCILSEVNTHRVFSRNSASSRARSMKTTITEVMEDPYIPLFTKNMRGMSGDYLNEWEREQAVDEWLEARDAAVISVLNLLLKGSGKELNDFQKKNIRENFAEHVDTYNELYRKKDESILSPHKQNVNRLLEPFMWHEAIISSTEWKNFFELRDHDAAQPEIRAIAVLMREAIKASVPQRSWLHIPFKDEQYELFDASNGTRYSAIDLIENSRYLLMSSAGDCARVSYKSKIETGSVDSARLGEILLEEGHMSPFEHIAFPRDAFEGNSADDTVDNYNDNWVQLRTLLW